MSLEKKRIEELEDFAKKLKIKVNNLHIFNQALVHSSYAHEQKDSIECNEKLEFLGDAVLSLVTSEYLYQKFPKANEGSLSKLRARIVSEPVLSKNASQLVVGRYLLLGRGEEATGGRDRDSILANTFEAIIGAIYLDSGLGEAYKFIIEHMENEMNTCNIVDYKSQLQEWTQVKLKKIPIYRVIDEIGPEHEKIFDIELSIDNVIYGRGQGKSKKQAEQLAAQMALVKLEK
ncbi:MAG: ribonuclease III [bacterium]